MLAVGVPVMIAPSCVRPTTPTPSVTRVPSPQPTGSAAPTADTASSSVLTFSGSRPQNLLVISIDTLRKDHITPYGKPLTPFLAARFAEGVSLDDHVQCSNWTTASVACTMTGFSAIEGARVHGVLPQLQGGLPAGVPVGMVTLATILGEAGYTSLHYTTNRLFSAEAGVAQGFDATYVSLDEGVGDGALNAWNDAATKFSALAPVGPWYLHLHLMDPHRPYAPPEAYLDAVNALPPFPIDLSLRAAHKNAVDAYDHMDSATQDLLEQHLRLRYEAEVAYLDDQLALIWVDLDQRGLLDDTLVVFWTDHGEQFWEHGEQLHGQGLFGEETDAVALLWSRTLQPARWGEPTSTIDLVPTVLDALSVASAHPVEGQGVGTAEIDRPRFFATVARHGPMQAVERAGQKLVFTWKTGVVQVFDRRADPGELKVRDTTDDPEALALWLLLRPRIESLGEHLGLEPVWPADFPAPKAP